MDKRLRKGAVGLGAVLALLGLLGCAGNTRDESEAPVFILVQIQPGESLAVWGNIQESCSDVAQIVISHNFVGGGGGTSPYTDAILKKIVVTYANKAGGNVPGWDIPYPFSFEFNQIIATGGVLEIDNFPVLTAEQKVVPPLDRSTGAVFPMQLVAYLTAYAETVDGEKLQPSTLDITVTVLDESPRTPPCPSFQ